MTTLHAQPTLPATDPRDPEDRLLRFFDAGSMQQLAARDTSGVLAARGTVQGYYSCNTCVDLDCSAACTGGTCDPEPTPACPPGTNGTECGPGGSDPNMSCFSDEAPLA